MLNHKDIIVRVLFTFFFVAITFYVLGPVFLNYIKKKLPGHYDHDHDLDLMIKRQKERLRAQYGLNGDTNQYTVKNNNNQTESTSLSKEMKELHQEVQWGAGPFLKELQIEITKNFSYTIADTKVNSFIYLCQKRGYFYFLDGSHQQSKEAIKNYLVALLVFLLIVDEIKERNFFVIEKIARKLKLPAQQIALAFQLKILLTLSSRNSLKEDRIFSEGLVLGQYSDESLKNAIETIAKKEANLWAKSTSQLFEELNLTLNYAALLTPLPKLKNKKDMDTAFSILGVSENDSLEDIKKVYKKLALQKHPDKIVSQKLPKVLEKKAIERFNQIQEAYEVITALKK